MKRTALEHIIRAAADVTAEKEFVIVGSAAILAQYPDAPDIMLRSNEADIYPTRSPEKAWDIEGSLGSGSMFHETYGYFADGVAPEIAKLLAGWRARAHILKNRNTGGATAVCPEIHDLAASKVLAGRPKDREWVSAGIAGRLIRVGTLRERIEALPVRKSSIAAALRRLGDWRKS